MAFTEIEHAQKRIQQKWRDLVIAEQQGASIPALERMYNAYMLAVEEYNRCCEMLMPATQDGRRERKAS